MHDITRDMFHLLIRSSYRGTPDRVFFKILLLASFLVAAYGCSSVREDTRNILFAAEQWFYIKKCRCLELRKLVESRREIQDNAAR